MSITQLQGNITGAKEKIEKYNSVIGSISPINDKLSLCAETLITTGGLIGEAIIIYGKPADDGKTKEIAAEVSNCANDFSRISAMATNEINKLNEDINGWQNQISRLQQEERERQRERERLAKEEKKA